MMKASALKIVESPAFYKKEFDLPESENAEVLHSLHYALMLPGSILPEFASFFISRFSRKGQVVLDPFASSGAVGLESALLGRVPMTSDVELLPVEISKAKLHPADLTEVTLKLQFANLKRPVDLRAYKQVFSSFYDVDTYRELLNLRDYLHQQNDRASKFIALLAASLLHGNNAGYFSVYSLPHMSLTPQEQQEINFRRCQTPDYRPLVPRILRRAAQVFRDGIPSILHHTAAHSLCCQCDARDLSYLKSATVDLVVTAPPLPDVDARMQSDQQWLRNWFLDITRNKEGHNKESQADYSSGSRLEAWKDFMNEALLEMARVVMPGGRAVLDLYEILLDDEVLFLENALVEMVQENLSRYWEAEGVYVHKQKFAKLRNCNKERDPLRNARKSRALILRRR